MHNGIIVNHTALIQRIGIMIFACGICLENYVVFGPLYSTLSWILGLLTGIVFFCNAPLYLLFCSEIILCCYALSLILDHLVHTGDKRGDSGSDHTIFVGDLAHGVTDSMLEDDDWMAQRIWFGAYTFGTTFRYSIIGYEDERSIYHIIRMLRGLG
ncbi:hypothetical protein ACJX0J_029345, partial [Zea mays]